MLLKKVLRMCSNQRVWKRNVLARLTLVQLALSLSFSPQGQANGVDYWVIFNRLVVFFAKCMPGRIALLVRIGSVFFLFSPSTGCDTVHTRLLRFQCGNVATSLSTRREDRTAGWMTGPSLWPSGCNTSTHIYTLCAAGSTGYYHSAARVTHQFQKEQAPEVWSSE